MSMRRKSAPYTDERAALAARMQAPPNRENSAHGPALQAVAGDPDLCARLRAAASLGLPPVDLGAVPLHRRPQAVEDAVRAFEESTAGGPCGYCGSITRRTGRGGTLGFTVRGDRAACGWCIEVIREHGEAVLRVRVFLAAAGCRRTGGLHNPPGALFAHEMPGVGDGTPWSHINRAQARAVAKDRLHPTCFNLTAGDADHVAMPGLPPHQWAVSDLPERKPTVYWTFETPAAASARKEGDALVARGREQRARARKRIEAANASMAGRAPEGLPV